MIFNRRLKMFRLKNNLTQLELANKIGVSSSALAMYERGERRPDFETLIELSKVLHVNVAVLLGVDSQIPPELPELSEGEKAIVDLFRLIPKEQQKHFLEMGRVFADSLKKD